MAKQCILTLALLILATGSAVAGVEGFKLESIQIVDLRRQVEIEWLSSEPRPMKALISATFSTDVDLEAYSRRYDFNVGQDVGVCQEKSTAINRSKSLSYYSGVYDSFGEVNSRRKVVSPPDSSPTYLYHVYIDVMFERPGLFREPVGSQAFLYDLRKHPEDVCVQIRGGNMMGMTFRSNTVMIPKEDIAAAISQSDVLIKVH
jgi:hypothetical protein